MPRIGGGRVLRVDDLIDLGVDKGLLEKSGTWISFGGERMGQGRENARVFLKENKDIRDKLENALRKKMQIPVSGQNPAATGANGANGHANMPAEKPPLKAAAAVASTDNKARPAR